MAISEDTKHRELMKSMKKLNESVENINRSIENLTKIFDRLNKATAPIREQLNEDNSSNDI